MRGEGVDILPIDATFAAIVLSDRVKTISLEAGFSPSSAWIGA
jgi:hypothetical protein